MLSTTYSSRSKDFELVRLFSYVILSTFVNPAVYFTAFISITHNHVT